MVTLISIAVILWSAAGALCVLRMDDSDMHNINNFSISRKILVLFMAGPFVWIALLYYIILGKEI